MAGNELAVEYMVLTELAYRRAVPERPSLRAGLRTQAPAGTAHPAPRRLLHRLGDELIAAGARLHGRAGAPAQARP